MGAAISAAPVSRLLVEVAVADTKDPFRAGGRLTIATLGRREAARNGACRRSDCGKPHPDPGVTPIYATPSLGEYGRMPGQRLTRVLLAAGGVACVAVVALAIASAEQFPETALWALPMIAAYAGGVVAVRAQPDNLAARRLLAFGAVAVIWLAASVAFVLAYDDAGAGDWFVPANAVVQCLGLLMAASIAAMLAVYPDGVPHRAADRRVPLLAAGLAVALPPLLLLAGDQVTPAWIVEWWGEVQSVPPPAVDSPLHIDALSFLEGPLRGVHESALGLVPATGVVLAAMRYRRANQAQRLQLKWPFYAALLLTLHPIADLLAGEEVIPVAAGDTLEVVTLFVLPAALAVGLVRPDLFDLELAVRRSAVYAVLWVAIVAAYAGIAAALGIAVGGENLQIAVIVAIVATLSFEPLRRALARRAARYAYGDRIEGDELLRRLGATLEHTLDIRELVTEVAAMAREGMGARWVRIALTDGSPEIVDGVPAPGERAALSIPLDHAGDELGVIECGPSASGRPYGDRRELLVTLARQAALAMTNARLAGELRHRLDELAASRSRIVEAEERARRRIERDIHDGAQQELAALIARIGLAHNQLRRGDPAMLSSTLEDLRTEAQQALENLRDLAAGIHPSVLTDRGLVEAIETRASRLPLGVTIECDPGLRATRFTEPVEGAVYFLVCESFANTLKHAGAERVVVRITRAGGRLHVEISDDGRGFDPAEVDRAGGLAGLADRLAALGGELEVSAGKGGGTRLRATVPAGERAYA
jgi:signal transduction histidine kinase